MVLRAPCCCANTICRSDQALFRPWHLLCSQLLHVVVEVLRYTTIDVLEPLWADMHSRLQQAGNMDEVCGVGTWVELEA